MQRLWKVCSSMLDPSSKAANCLYECTLLHQVALLIVVDCQLSTLATCVGLAAAGRLVAASRSFVLEARKQVRHSCHLIAGSTPCWLVEGPYLILTFPHVQPSKL